MKSPAHVCGGASQQKTKLRIDGVFRQARLSSDNPILNAFWRVAPSVRFSFLAILAAGVFFFASDFSSRTCTDVHERLFFPFFMRI